MSVGIFPHYSNENVFFRLRILEQNKNSKNMIYFRNILIFDEIPKGRVCSLVRTLCAQKHSEINSLSLWIFKHTHIMRASGFTLWRPDMCDVCQLACPTHFGVCLRVCSRQMNSEGVKTAFQRSLCCSSVSAVG